MGDLPEGWEHAIEALRHATGNAGKVLEMATVDAARGLGRAHELGSIEPGKLEPGGRTERPAGKKYKSLEEFLDARPEGAPFCFWFGTSDPHRAYKKGSGEASGMDLAKVPVPDFFPDVSEIRSDIADYYWEVQRWDRDVAAAMKLLEETGELDNTIIAMTGDHGMPFPRIKGQEYEYSNHLPLAIMWPDGISNPGRVVDDFVRFIDFAPTYFELAGLDAGESGMAPMQGQSLTDIFYSEKSGSVTDYRDHVLIGKERHDIGRPHDWGYPIRGIIKNGYLLINNYETDRWPAGNPETGYLNCDGSPTKTVLLNGKTNPETFDYWNWNFGKRPAQEFYKIDEDPECMNNLIGEEQYADLINNMLNQMQGELEEQGDPRMSGQGHIFDEYTYAQKNVRGFYERYMNGEKMNTGWVNDSDYEKNTLD